MMLIPQFMKDTLYSNNYNEDDMENLLFALNKFEYDHEIVPEKFWKGDKGLKIAFDSITNFYVWTGIQK